MLYDTEIFRDNLPTVTKEGKRIWLYPKQPKGPLYNARTVVSVVFLILFFTIPFIKYGGDPILLFNVLERRFILFGLLFAPQDFYLFLLATLTFFVFIILFTVVFGRLFCGWVCPQTVFMEMIFRKIEYWIDGDHNAQRKLDNAEWSLDKLKKRLLKHAIFLALAVLFANFFLAYIIGMDAVLKIVSQPIQGNLAGFSAMILFSTVFYGVFSRLREQVCTTICPYGRLQSVLLIPDSVVVAYDFVRGEPRGKLKKQTEPIRKDPCKNGCPDCAECAASSNLLNKIEQNILAGTSEITTIEKPKKTPTNPITGDCIDCKLCIQVCPTGIDIRNGTQLECTNCTACIDACNEVMVKINKPKGLIRYDSLNGIKKGQRKIFTTRATAYSVVLALLLTLDFGLLTNRSDISATILRSSGTIYQTLPNGHVTNLYTYQVVNKTRKAFPLSFKTKNGIGQIKLVGDQNPILAPEKMCDGAFFIDMDSSSLDGLKTILYVEISSENTLLKTIKTSFVGPIR